MTAAFSSEPGLFGQLSLSLACNLRHTFCCQAAFAGPRLSDEVLYERLAPLYAHTERLKVIGGEPLVFPGLRSWLEWLGDRWPEMRIVLTTNGLKLDESWVDFAASRNISFIVSLHTLSPEIAARILRNSRAAAVQERIAVNLARLAERHQTAPRPLIDNLAMVVNRDTAPGMLEMVEYAVERGLDLNLQYDTSGQDRLAETEQEELRLEGLKMAHWAGDLIDVIVDNVPTATREAFARLTADGRFEADRERFARRPRLARRAAQPRSLPPGLTAGGVCPDLDRGFAITADGSFRPCCFIHHGAELGNVNTDSLVEIRGGVQKARLRSALAAGQAPWCAATCPHVRRPEACLDRLLPRVSRLLREGRPAEARRLLADLPPLGMTPPAVFYYLASCHQMEGAGAEALVLYDQALAAGGDEAWIRFRRGSLLADLNRAAEAGEDLALAKALGHAGAAELLARLRGGA